VQFGGKAQEPKRRGPEQAWRRHLRTTREGKVFILFTLGVGLAAVNTGSNLIFLVFGFMLSLIVLSGLLSELALRNITVTRQLPERAFAGVTSLIELVLHNQKRLIPSYALEIEDLAEGEIADRHCYFLKVGGQAKQPVSYRRLMQRRGMLHFYGYKISTRYPFGILEKWRNLYGPSDLLVYPGLAEEAELESGPAQAESDGIAAPKAGAGPEIAGLRDYRPGDDARAIHWLRSASLGRTVVREREREPSARLAIVLDNTMPENADEEWNRRFEAAISRAASLAVTSIARGMAVEIITKASRSPLIAGGAPADPILRFLALIDAIPGDAPLAKSDIPVGVQVIEVPV
jgi:uncharacterized protein (DUF58 family)